MTGENWIKQLEQTMTDIRAGDETAVDRLITHIEIGNFEYSQGIAIGQNIQQVVVIIQGDHPQVAERLKQAKKELNTRFKLPDIPPVSQGERVQRREVTERLFISYSHADTLPVNRIAKRLNEEHYYDVWIDYDSIPLGDKWRESIARGITDASRVLFMASPHSLSSPACREELRYAREKDRRIIPVRLTTALRWEDLSEIDLYERQGIDFSGGESDALWNKLLDNLPPILARDRRRIDKHFRRLHTDYLRTIFNRCGRVNQAHGPMHGWRSTP